MRLLLLLTCSLAASAAAQAPALSGTWIAASGTAPATLPAAPTPILGQRFGLEIGGGAVVLTRPAVVGSVVTTLPLDGSVTVTALPGLLCAGERMLHETAAADGDALVLRAIGAVPPGGVDLVPADSRFRFRLDGPERLVVEGTMVVRGERRQVGTVYVRTADPLPPPRPALPREGVPARIGEVAWIAGTWNGTTGPVTTEEWWTPPASGGMIASARTLRGTGLSAFEFLCIAERNGTLVYLAMPNGRTPATPFVATEVTPTSVTFENPSHDFPKLIRYRRTADGGMETTIAGAAGAGAATVSLSRTPPRAPER
ncbi:MAG: DUF6265 family protein [Gemmatimonadales bacterium]